MVIGADRAEPDGSVVDEDMQAAKRRERLAHCALTGAVVGDVGSDGELVGALGQLAQIKRRHLRAFGEERLHEHVANAAGGAGNDRDFAAQPASAMHSISIFIPAESCTPQVVRAGGSLGKNSR